MSRYTFGFDPEVFFRDNKTGKIVSCHEIVPGTKAKPHRINDNFCVQVDGLSCEFNTRPTSDKFEAVKILMEALDYIDETYCKPNDLSLAIVPVAEFDANYLRSLPKHVSELGCTPDYNAWESKENPPPNAELPFRTGSGHIHIGWRGDDPIENVFDPDHIEDCETIVRALDFTVGVQSLIWDEDHRRRELYGQPGAYRPKPYGLEYRVLSNAMLIGDYAKHKKGTLDTSNSLVFQILDHIYRALVYLETRPYVKPHKKFHYEATLKRIFKKDEPFIPLSETEVSAPYGEFLRKYPAGNWHLRLFSTIYVDPFKVDPAKNYPYVKAA